MMRVGVWLARGIVVGSVLFTAGTLPNPTLSRRDHALALVRAQDFSPLFGLAGSRIGGYFVREREERFLEEVFSVSGKWKAVTRSRESYEKFIRKTFERTVFNPRDFAPVLEQVKQDYAYGIAAAENRLLVALYEDLRPQRPDLTLEGFRTEYGKLAATLAPHVARDLGMNVVAFAGSEAATVLLVAALSSAGILGGSVAAGTAGGPWTFGISLVVGIVAGLALDALVGEEYEAAARMEIHASVNGLRNRIIDDVHDALVRALVAYRELQAACVRRMFDGGSHETLAHRP